MKWIAWGVLSVAAIGCGGSTGEVSSGGGASATTSTGTSSSTGETTGSGGAGGSGAGGATTGTTSSTSGSGGSGGQPTAMGCVTDVSVGHHVFPCDGGILYDVEVPPACASGGCGMVLDMHGYTMNSTQEEAGTGMRALGHLHGYVIVQPTGTGIPSGWVQQVDAPRVFAFVSDLQAALALDPKRAHVMGFSQGGGMTWRMICAHADFFASAAPLSGINGCEWTPPNAPSREVPTLQVHGHKDNIVNFAAFAIPQRDAALAFWKAGAGAVLEADPGHTATRYLTPSGTPFEFWEHDYAAGSLIIGGHCFPGGADVGISPFQFGCAEQGTFDVGTLAMEFFMAHPMP